jgi:hypothetical protein
MDELLITQNQKNEKNIFADDGHNADHWKRIQSENYSR